MQTGRQVVDYALRRRAALAGLRRGRNRLDEVCDAGTYLLRAARFHGRGTDTVCPVCRKENLTLVSWVFGESLGRASGSARGVDELERFAASRAEFTVHEVEVCTTCRWNYLVRSYVLGRESPPRGASHRRRTAGP